MKNRIMTYSIASFGSVLLDLPMDRDFLCVQVKDSNPFIVFKADPYCGTQVVAIETILDYATVPEGTYLGTFTQAGTFFYVFQKKSL